MKDRNLAPIALFAYKRCDHLKATIESLARNPEARNSRLMIFSDGSKKPADAAAVARVRSYISGVTGFAHVETLERPDNIGLSASITQGVSQMLRAHERVIVVEDDLVVSPHFLTYMNDGLECYERDETVASIHGYMYPSTKPLPETFFLRGADCWGWATWRRAWRHFNSNGSSLLAQLKNRGLIGTFDYDGAAPFSRMLKDQIAGNNDSWAIRWHASCYLDGLFTLYPGRSLVHNIGNDGSGTHNAAGKAGQRFGSALADAPLQVKRQPIIESQAGHKAVGAFFRRAKAQDLRGRIVHLAWRILSPIMPGKNAR